MKQLSVAIIGNGVVGQATKRVVQCYHRVTMHDPMQQLFCDYDLADIVFICTPTECVQEYLDKLKDHPYVYVRSTIPFHMVRDTDFAVWPEFLTERTAVHDSLHPKLNVVGGTAEQTNMLAEATLFSDFRRTTNVYAALMKLTTNVYFSHKVTFANMIHNLCKQNDLDYDTLKNVLGEDARTWIEDHWAVPGPDGKFGYGGKCLPANVDIMLEMLEGKDKELLNNTKEYNQGQRDENSDNRSGRLYRFQPGKSSS